MKRLKQFFLMFLTLAGMVFSAGALAEKADADQPTNIEANQMSYDDLKQINTFIGNIVLTRGTLLMKADKVVVTTDPAGYQFATLYGAPGTVATFRQKRDGGPNLWVEGQAERIEYDTRTEIAKLFSHAKLKRLDGSKTIDEVEGEFISYDSSSEFFNVTNSASGVSTPGSGRIKVIIQPRTGPIK